MKSTYLFVAAAALLTASCADDSSLGGSTDLAQSKAIAFDMQTPAMLKATETGGTAAGKLGNEFIVWGEKNEADDGSAADATNQVFENYRVQYTDGSKYTTTSNIKDWEYVGIEPYKTSQVSPVIDASKKQTIKYWDYNANSYTFTAVSAKQDDITAGNVIITKKTTGTSVYDKGYTIELKAGASAGDIYVADRNVIKKPTANGYDREAKNEYGGNATLTFRNFQTKVRFALYEVIPGYKVKVTGVKFNGTESTDKFGVTGKFITAGDGTKYTVTYEDGKNGSTENKAKVAVGENPTTADYLEGGNGVFGNGTDVYLGTESTKPTYDKASGEYTAILPYPSNGTNMELTISYDLISEDTGEKISLKEKTAEVPAAYCQWQANYAYTYIFKITDNAADLYPITFDAQVITDENGKQETITSVSEPSITTFAVKDNKVITGKDEYEAGDDIYASVIANHSEVTLSASNTKIYTVTSTDATTFPITAASVANAIAHKTDVTTGAKITATELTNSTSIETTVPVGDGSTATRALSAIKWTAGTAGTIYAVEYSYTDNGTDKKVYKIIKIATANN